MPQVHLLWLRAPEIARSALPGQFLMVATGYGQDPLLRRPFSLHRVDQEGKLALLFNVVGRGTAWLAGLKRGDKLDLLGPLGNSFRLQAKSVNLLLIGGGMGIAPLVMLADQAIKEDREVTLLLGARGAEGLYPSQLLPPEVELVISTDDGSVGRKGLVTDLVPEYLDWADQIFACGPSPMYQALAGVLRRRPTRKQAQVSLEAHMACGFGVCYGCALETHRGMRLVCKDGPIFNLRDIW